MPELPDLEMIRRVLVTRVVDVGIGSTRVLRPLVVRNLLGGELGDHLEGNRFTDVCRRGKYLLLPLDSGAILVIHPMLAGRLRYGSPLPRHRKRDSLVINLADGNELRYHDAKDMGKVYLVNDVDQVPTFTELGPEAIDPDLTLERFRERLHPRRGEIKGILVDQAFLAGIGNAYADEILWRARIYPFRRRPSLSAEEVAALHEAVGSVLSAAIEVLGQRMGLDPGEPSPPTAGRGKDGAFEDRAPKPIPIDVEIRDFLSVHGRKGQPCPRCGTTISEVQRQGSGTNFCRTCQPGLMVAKGRRLD